MRFLVAVLLLALLAVLRAAPALAQPTHVEGRIVDAETQQPVAGASIQLRGTGRGTAADDAGHYRLALPEAGPFTLVVSAVGYAPAERSAMLRPGEVLRLDVALEPIVLEGASVVVTATRTAKELEDVAVPTTVVDAAAIRTQGAVRLGEVLEAVPGLFLFDDHGSGLQVQGFAPDYTLVLLDGEPVVGRTAGTLDLDRLSVHGVERVEVVRGPSSSLYGSEALAGVVNLVTALPDEGAAARLGLRAGSHGTTDLTAEAAAGQARWGARLLLNRYASGGYDLTPEAFGPTVPAFADWTADLRARAALGRATLRLGARLALQSQHGAFAGTEAGAEARYDDTARRSDWSLHPKLVLPLSRRLRLTGTLYGARYTTETRHHRRDDGALTYQDDFDQRYAKAELQLDALWGARHLSVAGAGVIGERLAGDRYTGEPAVAGAAPAARQLYAFLQHEWMPGRLLELNASARLDAHSDYAARLTPKLSALVRPFEGVRLRASVGSGFKAPAFRQLYLAFTNASAGYSVFGSTRLAEGLDALEAQGQLAQRFLDPTALGPIRAESSLAYNVGLAVDVGPGLRLEAGGFWNEVSDLIETQPVAQKTNGQAVFGYFNLDRIYTRGLEAQGTARPVPGLELAAGYQFLQARDRALVEALEAGTVFGRDADGRERRLSVGDYGGLFGRSPHAATLRATLTRGAATASLRGRWRSRYGYRDLDGNGLANRNDEFVAGYAVLDLTLTHAWALPGPAERLMLQLGAENLFGVTRAALVPSMPGRTLFAALALSL